MENAKEYLISYFCELHSVTTDQLSIKPFSFLSEDIAAGSVIPIAPNTFYYGRPLCSNQYYYFQLQGITIPYYYLDAQNILFDSVNYNSGAPARAYFLGWKIQIIK